MRINQDNYEQFFLDHVEGNLSPEMEKELTDFLEANPDLKPVFENFDPSPLPFEEINNDSLKKRLKKNIHPTNLIDEDHVDEWMIRDVEGLMDETEENELKEFLLLNPAYSFDFKLFGHTKMVPDLSISYRRKNELKKKGILLSVSRLVWLLPAAAAVILLFFGIRFFQQPGAMPAHPLSLPIAMLPRLSSPEIAANNLFSVLEKNTAKIGTPSRDPSFRIKPIENQASITHPIEEVVMNITSRNSISVITVDNKEPTLIARVFNNMLDQARDGISNQANFDRIRKPDFSFWSIAKVGIEGFNSISDRDLELYVRKNKDGKVKSYALIDQERLIWSKDMNKE